MTPPDLNELERLEREAVAAEEAYGSGGALGMLEVAKEDFERALAKHGHALIREAREAERLREHVRVLREALRPVAGQAIEIGAMELPAYIVRDARVIRNIWAVIGIDVDGDEYLWDVYEDRDEAESIRRRYAENGWKLREFTASEGKDEG